MKMRLTPTNRKMLISKGLGVRQTPSEVVIYRLDNRKMTATQYKLAGKIFRESGGYKMG